MTIETNNRDLLAAAREAPDGWTLLARSAWILAAHPDPAVRDGDRAIELAERAVGLGATTYCIVTSLRRPGRADMETICRAATEIKARFPVRVCVSLGLLDEEKAKRLRAAGVDRYNHNLETSRSHFPNVCTTHRWEDRVATVRAAQEAGLEA